MRKKLWLNVALAAAVIALALLAWLKPPKSEPELKLSHLAAADVNRIAIQVSGAPPIALERAPAGWRMTAPVDIRADDFQVQRLLALADATARERFAASGLARFDLNEPYARVSLNQQTFSFGAVNQMSREQYVLTQDGVYLVHLRYAAALPKDALQLASKQLFTADEAPVAFELRDLKLVQRDGRWQLEPPQPDASADDINRWVDEWKLAAALSLAPASGRKPIESIRIGLKNGNAITLAVLEREPSLVLARSDRKLEYHFPASAARRLLASPAGDGTRP